jgi:hypothetical protein
MVPSNGHIPKAVLVSNTGVDENVHLKISLLQFPIDASLDQDKISRVIYSSFMLFHGVNGGTFPILIK